MGHPSPLSSASLSPLFCMLCFFPDPTSVSGKVYTQPPTIILTIQTGSLYLSLYSLILRTITTTSTLAPTPYSLCFVRVCNTCWTSACATSSLRPLSSTLLYRHHQPPPLFNLQGLVCCSFKIRSWAVKEIVAMGSIADPGGELGELTQPPSFDEFQRQTSLMTSCTLLWKELSDHFSSVEQDLQEKAEALKRKIKTLDSQTKESLQVLQKREVTIDGSISIALGKVDERKEAALNAAGEENDAAVGGEVDDAEGLLLKLRSYCTKMEAEGFWRFVTARKKELDSMRAQMPFALADCVDPSRFVLEAISEVFPVDKRAETSDRGNDLGWACVLMLESLIPVVIDPILGNSRLLVTPSIKERAKEIAEAWKASLDQRGGIENVKTPDVHTFLQHLVTFGIVKKEDVNLYRKLVVGSAWRKQMPKLAVSLGLGDEMPDMIEELISRGQQVDAVHFTYEVGLQDKFPPVPLLKAFLKDAKKAADSISEDPNNSGRAAHLAARKEQSALRAVIKCIEEYKLEADFPPENLKKRLEQLEKSKNEKRKPAAVPANKRTRANNGGPMPPAKAGRSTNAYVSSFPTGPTFVRSPSHTQYPAGVPAYHAGPAMYGNRSPPASPYAYSPEAASPPYAGSYPGIPINYPPYGGYANGVAPAYQPAYYR